MLQAMASALALRRQSWSRLGLYLCVFAVAAETVQLLTLDRTSQVADAGLNILSVITGLALGAILRRLKKMFATASLAHFNSETVLWPRVFQGAQALGRGTAEAQGHFAPGSSGKIQRHRKEKSRNNPNIPAISDRRKNLPRCF